MMSLAISLAEQRIGLTGENPSVGCVIVKNNKIISFGQTGLGGTPHAEVDAINKAKLEKFDKLNSSKIVSDMESQIDDMLQDEEGITKFVEAGGAKMDDFNENKDKLKSFVAQKLYEKEFTEVRIKSIESINDTVEEIKVEILDGLEEKQLKLLEQTLLGEQLLNSMEAAFERLDKASAKLKEVEKKAKAQ